MLTAVKNAAARLVGAERNAPSHEPPKLDREKLDAPLAAARERAEVANQQHQESMARVDEAKEQIRVAEAAFDRDGHEEQADEIVTLKRELERRQIFSQRTQRAAVTAAGAVEVATKDRDGVLLKHLDERSNTAAGRIHTLWWEEGAPALTRLARVVTQVEAIINDAIVANAEAHRLRGTRNNVPPHMTSDMLKGGLIVAIEKTVETPTLIKLRRLFGG